VVLRAAETHTEAMDWNTVLTALLALAGVWVGAYLQRLGNYEEWRRNRLYDLYVELVPVLRRAQGALGSEQALMSNKVAAELSPLIVRAEILCSPEALAGIKGIHATMKKTGVPWYVKGDDREQFPRTKQLGTESAMRRQIEELMSAMASDMKAPRWRSARRLVRLLERRPRPAEDRPAG
jgi:hypothetical protein